MRTTVTFDVHGTTVEGWAYSPADATGPVPVVVLGHGLGYVKSAGLDAFARRFVEAGYAALAFDYRSFGGSGGEPRQVLSVKRQLEDWDAAIAFARTLPGVDGDRVVVWGTSFGGGHALTLAHRSDLAAAIAQCPFTDGIASLRVVPTITSLKVTWAAVRDLVARLFRRDPVYIAGSAPAGATAMMTAPDAEPAMQVLTADAPDFENRMAGRAAVEVMLYGPGRKVKGIRTPVLAAVCDRDTVAPSRTATRQLARSSAIEVRHHDVGHFEIYLGEPFEAAVADYLEFLDRVVPIEPHPAP